MTYPDRLANRLKPLDLASMGQLTFEAPDPERFPALRLAREAGTKGGTLPAVLNAANEIAVPAFLDGKILFPAIWHTVEAVMKAHTNVEHPTLEQILKPTLGPARPPRRKWRRIPSSVPNYANCSKIWPVTYHQRS